MSESVGIKEYCDWFFAYTESFVSKVQERVDQENIKLKQDHSFRVLAEARKIIENEKVAPKLRRTTLLAALFHDLGRFEQYLGYRTFKDSQSIDHGLQGFKVLVRSQALVSLPRSEQKKILYAVLWHNKKDLVPGLPFDLLTILSVVRDADKLDIISVLLDYMENGSRNRAVTLGLRDDPKSFSTQLLESLLKGQGVDYQSMVWVNDFRLLLLSWYFSFNFPWSRAEMLRRGHVKRLLAGLPESPDLSALHRLFS